MCETYWIDYIQRAISLSSNCNDPSVDHSLELDRRNAINSNIDGEAVDETEN